MDLKLKYRITVLDILIICFVLWMIISSFLVNERVVSNERITHWYVLLMVYLFIRLVQARMLIQSWFYRLIAFAGFVQSVIGWLQYLGKLDSNHSQFLVTGSFNNPGPYACFLGVTLLILLYFFVLGIRSKRAFLSAVLLGTILVVAAMFVFVFSRASIVAMIVSLSIFLFRKKGLYYKYGALLFTLLIMSSIFLYHIKKDSADGRLFIWKVGVEILKDKKFTGGGGSSFSSRYMFFQSHYLQKNPNSEHGWNATDNIYAFNELLRISCEYGIIGLLLYVLIIVIGYLSRSLFYDELRKTLFLYLIIFSLFSYPLEIIELSIIFISLLALSNQKNGLFILNLSLAPLLFACIIATIGFRFISQSVMFDRYYVSSMAKKLYKQKDYRKAMPYLMQVAKMVPTSEVLTDIGNCCFYLREYERAITAYQTAIHMTPARILPRYYLFRLYVTCEQNEKAVRIGKNILKRKYRMEGSVSMEVKHYVKYYLKEHPDVN